MSYESIIQESSQNAFLIGGAKASSSFLSSKIGQNNQVYNARQGTRFATQNLVQIQPLTSVPQNLLTTGGYIDYQIRTPPGFFCTRSVNRNKNKKQRSFWSYNAFELFLGW